MRLWYRDKVLQVLLAMLVGTFTFSFTLLAGVEENSVPHVGVTVTGVLMAADMFLFLFFLDRFVHRLRPVAVAAIAAAAGRRAFDVRRPRGERTRRARDRARAAGVPRRADDGRAHPRRRLDPGDRRHAARPFRPGASLHARAQPRRRGLRPGRCGRDPGLRRRARRRAGRAQPSTDDRPRRRADDRAGSRLRGADHGRHRDQGALAGGQRPDDRRAGDQPSRRPAAPDRRDRLPSGARAERGDGTRPRRRRAAGRSTSPSA